MESTTLFSAAAAASKGEAVGAEGAVGSIVVAVVTTEATGDACGTKTGVSSLFTDAKN